MNGIHDLGGMLVVAAGEIVGRSHPLGGGPRGPRRVLRAPDRMSVKQIQISEPRRTRLSPPELRFVHGRRQDPHPSSAHRAISLPHDGDLQAALGAKSAYTTRPGDAVTGERDGGLGARIAVGMPIAGHPPGGRRQSPASASHRT
jgi:hypothetical protein